MENLSAYISNDRRQALAMFGMYDGSINDGKAILDPLLNSPGANLFIDQVNTYAYLNEHLLDDNLYPPPPDAGLIEVKKPGYIATPVPVSDWEKVVDYFKTTTNQYNIVVMEPYGGAINAVPVSDSAFIHRDVYMDFFVDSFFFESGKPTSRKQAEAWLDGLMGLMQSNFNGRMYQNYLVRNNPNFASAYSYDANNFFRFEQSIPPLSIEKSPAFAKKGKTGSR